MRRCYSIIKQSMLCWFPWDMICLLELMQWVAKAINWIQILIHLSLKLSFECNFSNINESNKKKQLIKIRLLLNQILTRILHYHDIYVMLTGPPIQRLCCNFPWHAIHALHPIYREKFSNKPLYVLYNI